MTILLLAEHDNTALSPHTARALGAATQIGTEIHLLVAGHKCAGVADQAAALNGVTKVLLADAEPLTHQLAEPLADLIRSLADSYDTILAPATSTGKNVLPRVAALRDLMQVSDIIAVDGPNAFRRPIYAGNAVEHVETSGQQIITVRTTAFAPAETGNSAPVDTLTLPALSAPTEWVEDITVTTDRPELTSAMRVVSGGRSLGSKAKFDEIILPLADALGAAVGASRDAVDEGYAPNDWQVGQTGKSVAPELYIACGISGAIQHVAGIKDAKIIVAINSDPEAPIFHLADYGLVGDLFELVPELTEALNP